MKDSIIVDIYMHSLDKKPLKFFSLTYILLTCRIFLYNQINKWQTNAFFIMLINKYVNMVPTDQEASKGEKAGRNCGQELEDFWCQRSRDHCSGGTALHPELTWGPSKDGWSGKHAARRGFGSEMGRMGAAWRGKESTLLAPVSPISLGRWVHPRPRSHTVV